MIDQRAREADELADRWASLPHRDHPARFHQLPRGQQDDFFLSLSAHEQAELLVALPESERRLWMRLLAPDDAADVAQHVDERERVGLLDLLDEPTRKEVNALLAFKEDEAGGRMNPRFARIRSDVPVDEAIAYLRRQAGYLPTLD
jgi:magnesium transporter